MNALERPTYVLATDGLFYRQPAVSGPGWVLTFEDRHARVELTHRDGDEWLHVHKRAGRLLTEAGIRGEVSGPISGEYDTLKGQGVVWVLYFRLTEPMPTALMRPGTGRRLPPGPARAHVLDFGQTWG